MNMKPIIPFEPIKTDIIPKGKQWIAQVKWDGVRIVTYYDGKIVKLYNRKLRERTYHYPELTDISSYCNADSVILDGELIALGRDGKPSFSTVMKRDGIRRLEKVPYVKSQIPITYMIFDVLYYNGNWVNEYKLSERIELLNKIIIPNPAIQLVPSFTDSEELFSVMKMQGMEGIIVKDINSFYVINGKSRSWQKKKNYMDIIAVIGGVTHRQGTVNSLLLGLYDEHHQFIYIGHAGTGKLKAIDWRRLTDIIKPLLIQECPFVNHPHRLKDSTWIQPILTVKVNFMEWTATKRLRQPSIQAFVDVNPIECRLPNE